jgi:hypothetical protein
MRKLIESTAEGVPERSEFYEISPKGVVGEMKSAKDLLPMTGPRSEELTREFRALLNTAQLDLSMPPRDEPFGYPHSA